MPQNPISLPYQPSREQAIEALRRVLGSPTEAPSPPLNILKLHYKPSDEPPPLNYGPVSMWKDDPYHLKDDPNMLLAAQLAQKQYPQVWNKLGVVNIGVPIEASSTKIPSNEGVAARVGSSLFNNPILKLGDYPSREWAGPDEVTTALDVLRHELSHVVGLPDFSDISNDSSFNVMTAYDVDRASEALHQDIDLPPAIKGLKRAGQK